MFRHDFSPTFFGKYLLQRPLNSELVQFLKIGPHIPWRSTITNRRDVLEHFSLAQQPPIKILHHCCWHLVQSSQVVPDSVLVVGPIICVSNNREGARTHTHLLVAHMTNIQTLERDAKSQKIVRKKLMCQ